MIDCQPTDLKHAAILIAVMLVESWMGKTDKIKSGSILELVLNSVLSLGKSLIKKGE